MHFECLKLNMASYLTIEINLKWSDEKGEFCETNPKQGSFTISLNYWKNLLFPTSWFSDFSFQMYIGFEDKC